MGCLKLTYNAYLKHQNPVCKGLYLGNVNVVINDRKTLNLGSSTSLYSATLIQTSDYYPFGMQMPDRHHEYTSDKYRFAYNGMELDNEVSGDGNSYTTEFRGYDPRLARWKSIDEIEHPNQSPYASFNNNPIYYVDPNGKSAIVTITEAKDGKRGTVSINMELFLYSALVEQLGSLDIDKMKERLMKSLLNVKTIIVNGEEYDLVWNVDVSRMSEEDAKTNMKKSLDASMNYARVMETNLQQIKRVKADRKAQQAGDTHAGFIALQFGGREGYVSEWGEIGGNTGTYSFAEIMKDFDVLLHELAHGLGLLHDDGDKNSRFPDILSAPGATTDDYPNMDKKYLKKNSNEINIGNNRVMTQNNVITAFKKAGFDINKEGTGINVQFKNGTFKGSLGTPNNTGYDRDGTKVDYKSGCVLRGKNEK